MNGIYDIIIIGAGPSGIFCSYTIREKNKKVSILVVDKGAPVDMRRCNYRCSDCHVCNILCGGGGAGLASDGKLTLDQSTGFKLDCGFPSDTLHDYVSLIDSIFTTFGHKGRLYFPKNKEVFSKLTKRGFTVKPYPTRHIGSEKIRSTCKNIINFLENEQIEFKWHTEVTEIKTNPSLGICTKDGNVYTCKYLILAVGRSGSLWLSKELKKLGLTTLPLGHSSIGVRIEFEGIKFEEFVNEVYDVKIEYDDCRTFCWNPYGEVILENYGTFKAVNGHAFADLKTKHTNFAVLCKTKMDVSPVAEKLNINGLPIAQNLGDFITGKKSSHLKTDPTLKRYKLGDISKRLPPQLLGKLCRFIKKLDEVEPLIQDSIVYAPEVKFLIYPIKINKQTFETSINNLYVVGDCSGYTASIVGAAMSGIIASNDLIKKLH